MGQPQRRIALICLVLAGDANAHGWYSGKTDPVLNLKCCSDHDCHPIDPSDVRSARQGYYVKQPQPYSRNDPPTGEWFIPWDRVQTAPDDQYHICENLYPTLRVGRYRMRWTCFFAPRATGSISNKWAPEPMMRSLKIVPRIGWSMPHICCMRLDVRPIL